MATQEKTWNVANRLHSQKDSDNPEVNHIIAGADEIYDDAKGAKQSDINAQADAALADRYTKAETYSKEQLDSLITTPDVNYVTVATFADLPQTGESNTIYRVSSYDGTQVDASKYALYAWNGAAYQLLAVRSAVGEVFDVSEYNSGATYETLTSALAAVPASVQRGGMSIKFILRTNIGTGEEPVYKDEYVQYRLINTAWSSVVSDWQGVDNEPTAGSENLVKSGGVEKSISDVYKNVAREYDDENNLLSMCDEQGNIIVKFNSGLEVDGDGNVKTSSFDSEDIINEEDVDEIVDNKIESDSVKQQAEESYDLSFSDNEGNIVLGLNDGNIKTKNFDSTLILNSARSSFPKLDVNKEEFRWLDIGNSHSLCALFYLREIAISQDVDLSNIAFCRLSRGGSSFKSWFDAYHDADTSGAGDELTGSMYDLVKDFGSLDVKVSGNTYTEPNGEATAVTNHSLTRTSTRFWGGDCSILRSLLKDNRFDLITIHQRYISNDVYDDHDRWRDDSEHGYLTEFIRILKTLQPQATIGCLFALVPFSYAGQTLAGMNDTHDRWSVTIRKFMVDTGIDIVLPCDTALANLRNSSVPNAIDEGSGEAETIVSRNGFNYDSAHTANGVAGYTMSCAAWEMILARRYGKTVYGNTYQELPSDDVGTTQKYLQGSYINNNSEKVMIDNGAWNAPKYIGCTSSDGGQTWVYGSSSKATIRVSTSNAKTCQMAAILAVNDIWKINNPDGIDL